MTIGVAMQQKPRGKFNNRPTVAAFRRGDHSRMNSMQNNAKTGTVAL
jgi:hypothetical protein